MKKILKSILILLLVAAFSIGAFIPSFAVAQQGKISVTLEDKEKNSINGIRVFLCRIAELNSAGYYPTAPFESSGISVSGLVNYPDDLAAKSVLSFIKEHHIDSLSKITENGKVTFSDLELGIWLVYCEEEGTHTFNPYLVFLPYKSGGEIYYEISGAPKTEDNTSGDISVSVIKKWDDQNNKAKKRPSEISVEILNGETVLATAELREEDGWAHVFQNLPKKGVYSVREKALPEYKATYSGDAENGFVITNTYEGEKLPQTGQYWWPIILISVAGIGFVFLGVYESLVKKNEKKK